MRFFAYLLFCCSVEVFDDAVLEDCRRSSIQLFARCDVAFIELLAVTVPLLLPSDVLDELVTIAFSQLLALLLLLLVLLPLPPPDPLAFVQLLLATCMSPPVFVVPVFISSTFE